MKHYRRKATLPIVIVLVISLVALVFLNLPKPVKTSDAAFDLTQIDDGRYKGSCDNGLVKVRVEVEVQAHEITKVNILEHNNGLGGSAEVIAEMAVQQQSVEVDEISGATMSSKTILKAIENALTEVQGAR